MPKDIALAHDLVPVGHFKSQAGTLLKAVANEGKTFVITHNGKAAAVVMSPREYDELQYQRRLVEELARALSEADSGNTQTTLQLRRSLSKRRRNRAKG